MKQKCWATLLTHPSYLPGVILLHHSLQKHNSKYPLIVLVTQTIIDQPDILHVLAKCQIETKFIKPLYPSIKSEFLAPRLEDAWTKLRVFEMVEWDTVVLLDADMLLKRNIDELFDIVLPEDWIAATHACVCNSANAVWAPKDWKPENCAYTGLPPYPPNQRTHTFLNSGLVILHPSHQHFNHIAHFLATSPLVPTLHFADQDLLAEIFRGKWKPLGWQYNALKTGRYQHPKMWRDEEVRNIHYIIEKPWCVGREKGGRNEVVNGWWWDEWEYWVRKRKTLQGNEREWVVEVVKRWMGEEDTVATEMCGN
ncbi:nucleotide-diphospho-sugar transferase [Kalaharituber pfeilii]|nr:nucleotide-diphospho-sugar transferase [Kalaharituber pfeilii]